MGEAGLELLSIECTVWMYPLRLVRQIGRRQFIPAMGTPRYLSTNLSAGVIKAWMKQWPNRRFWIMPLIRDSILVTRFYTDWTRNYRPE